MPRIVIATRGSQLALAQSSWVAIQLKTIIPKLKIKFKIIKTTSDKNPDIALSKIEEKGIFVKEIEEALLADQANLAIHSMKDIPTTSSKKLIIAAITKRANPYDALIKNDEDPFTHLPLGAKIGTSSIRRKAQLLAWRPDLILINIRGNIETRLHKMKEKKINGIILATAGLKRLKINKLNYKIFPKTIMLPAVGQGALGLQTKIDDLETLNIVKRLNHYDSSIAISTERSFLTYLQGGCRAAIAGNAHLVKNIVFFKGLIASHDGKIIIQSEGQSSISEAILMGRQIAKNILKCGGEKILI